MKTIAKASRVNTALQVIQHMNNGMTLVNIESRVAVATGSLFSFV
jgi:hypothetical protein